jgi:hypothetical protein
MNLWVIEEPLDRAGCGRDVRGDGAIGGGKIVVLTLEELKQLLLLLRLSGLVRLQYHDIQKNNFLQDSC